MTNDLATRIAEYLSGGGLFNPELADHNQVSLLIRDARDEIARLTAEAEWWKKEGAKLLQQKAALTAQLEKAREALEDAAECIESWGGYASAYFQDKHDLAGDLERIRTAARVHAETKPQSQS